MEEGGTQLGAALREDVPGSARGLDVVPPWKQPALLGVRGTRSLQKPASPKHRGTACHRSALCAGMELKGAAA